METFPAWKRLTGNLEGNQGCFVNIRYDPEDSSQNQSHQNSAQVRTWKSFWVISTYGVLKHLTGESLSRGGACGGAACGREGPLAEWLGHLQTKLLGPGPFSREGQAEARGGSGSARL